MTTLSKEQTAKIIILNKDAARPYWKHFQARSQGYENLTFYWMLIRKDQRRFTKLRPSWMNSMQLPRRKRLSEIDSSCTSSCEEKATRQSK
jgi:hypothetical protein